MTVPKTLDQNLQWRKRLRDAAAGDEGLQRQLRHACEVSALFWMNAFAWTFRQKMVNKDGDEVPCKGADAHWPFITWKVQDEAVDTLVDCIDNGHDAAIDKSRDMGASWICATVIHHYFQFRASTTFLEVSRKEELVDKRGDMDSLFEKHRYLLRMQPAWLRPRLVRDNYMNLGNEDIGSAIMGESTNGDVGRGGRKTAVLLDEFAAVKNGEEIDLSTADTTACRIFNSTPMAGAWFTKIVKSHPPRARVVVLPWWRHPEKGAGAHQVYGEDGKPTWTNHWFEKQCARRSKKDVAQNLNMDHAGAGTTFFDHEEIERHRRAHEIDPIARGELRILADDPGNELKARIIAAKRAEMIALVRGDDKAQGGAGWRFYIPLVNGRPPQHLSYVFGIDISNGAGASNSVISVVAHETGQIVAKFWSAFVAPEELAEIAALAGVWFGGLKGSAFIAWENNGPGGGFGRKLVKGLSYPHCYYQRVEGTKEQQKTTRWGWHSNNARKEVLLTEYREEVATGRLVNPCKESLDEALDYIYDEAGRLIPGKLKEESEGGRALHGDHVIADALTTLARRELPKFRPVSARPPAGSFADRQRAHKEKIEARDPWRD